MSGFTTLINEKVSFIFRKYDYVIVRKYGDCEKNDRNCQVTVSNESLDIKFTNDRGQLFIDFKSSKMKNNHWVSFGILHHILTKSVDFDEMSNGGNLVFLKSNYLRIR